MTKEKPRRFHTVREIMETYIPEDKSKTGKELAAELLAEFRAGFTVDPLPLLEE